jgi:hypothetical protein
MPTKLSSGVALALVCFAQLPTTRSATAITVELAKKCKEMTDKAFPLRVPGKPAAGREHGTPKELHDYFNKCAAEKGDIDQQSPDTRSRAQTPNERSDKASETPQKMRAFPDGLF